MPPGGTLAPERIVDEATVAVDGVPILRLRAQHGRTSVQLVMPGIDRAVDVSVSPATAVRALHEAARLARIPAGRAEADLRHALDALSHASPRRSPGAGIECPTATPDPTVDPAPTDATTSLVGVLGAAAFPILAAAYAAGATAIDEVPRWAAPILAEADARGAATAAFGRSATRPVVAAFARSLVRSVGRPVDVSRVALALIGAEVLEPDRIAALLGAPGDQPTAAVGLSPSRLAEARRVTRHWGSDRTGDYLFQAATGDEQQRRFETCLTLAIDLGAHAPVRVPRDLAELEDRYRLQVRTLPATTPATRPARPTRRRAAATAPTDTADADPRRQHRPGPRRDELAAPNYGIHLAPRVTGGRRLTDATAIPHPPSLRSIDGTTCGTFTLVLPRTCGDLIRWSRLLRNCLDTYTAAAVGGASHLIGVECDGSLRYVIEVTPQRGIRQFTGHANRPPTRADHDALVDHLRAHAVVG